MNDSLIIGLLGFLVALIPVVSPIIKLNNSITTLICNFEALTATLRRDEDELKEVKSTVNDVKSTVAQHEIDLEGAKKDIEFLYSKTEELEDRKE